MLVAAQAARARHVAGEEDRHRQLQVADQLFVQRFQLFQPFHRKRPTCGQGFVRDFTAHTLDNIRSLLQVKRHLDDFRPAAGFLFRQLVLGDPRQIELDGGIQHVDIVRQPAQLFFFARLAVHHLLQPFQHGFHRVAHAQRFAGGIGDCQRRSIQHRGVQMLRFKARVQLRFITNKPLAEAGHRRGKRHHRQTAHQVVEDVEVDHQLRFRQREIIHQVRQRVHKRQNDQATHQLKQ